MTERTNTLQDLKSPEGLGLNPGAVCGLSTHSPIQSLSLSRVHLLLLTLAWDPLFSLGSLLASSQSTIQPLASAFPLSPGLVKPPPGQGLDIPGACQRLAHGRCWWKELWDMYVLIPER